MLKNVGEKKEECDKCGRTGHWKGDCYAKYDISGKYISTKKEYEWICNYCDKKFLTKNAAEKHKCVEKNEECNRCGRTGHWKGDCYAKYEINGRYMYR